MDNKVKKRILENDTLVNDIATSVSIAKDKVTDYLNETSEIDCDNISIDVYTKGIMHDVLGISILMDNQELVRVINYNKDYQVKVIDEDNQEIYMTLYGKRLELSYSNVRILSLDINNFDKEKIARKIFEDYIRTILVKTNKFERINNDLIRKAKDFKYSYDLKDEDFKILDVLKEDLKGVKHDYDEIITAHRSKSFAYSRLAKEMEELNVRLSKVEEKLDYALKNLGSLKEDEVRAREQLDEIKEILIKAKSKINSYKLPVVPKKYYVELAEATNAIKEMIKELERQPISIKTLNIRVDTARDLVLKLYNTSKEIVKTCYLAEMSVVYGNRYRTTSSKVDAGLTRAEMLFEKGNFKASLENSINAISTIEPDFYHDLLSTFEK